MRVMVLYASVGGGHFKAAEGVVNYIKQNYPDYDVELVDALKYVNKVVDKIVIKSYVNMARYSPNMWGNIYKISEKQYSVSNFSNAVNRMLSLKLFNLFKEEQPDVVISTHPFITEMVASLKKHGKTDAKLCVILTDYASHAFWEIKHQYVDLYFVANEEMKYSMIQNGIAEDKITVSGIPFNPRFLETFDRNEILKEFDLEDKPTILLFGGGEYGLSNVKDIFTSLIYLPVDIQIVAIAGKSEKNQKIFEKLAKDSDKKIIILGYTNKVPELMHMADFVISKPGGLTTTEILISNIPFFIINPIPGQEEENSNFLLNNGAAARIYDAKKAIPVLKQLLSNPLRIETMKQMQRYLAKPDSTKKICEKIFGTA